MLNQMISLSAILYFAERGEYNWVFQAIKLKKMMKFLSAFWMSYCYCCNCYSLVLWVRKISVYMYMCLWVRYDDNLDGESCRARRFYLSKRF